MRGLCAAGRTVSISPPPWVAITPPLGGRPRCLGLAQGGMAGDAGGGSRRTGEREPWGCPDELVPTALAALQRRWPDIEVRIRSLSTVDQEAALAVGALDLALVRSAPKHPGLMSEPLLVEHLGIATRADDPLAAAWCGSCTSTLPPLQVGHHVRCLSEGH